MTQILFYHSSPGIVLATDGRAVTYPDTGASRFIRMEKLFRLGPNAVLATAGAGYGTLLCHDFISHVEHEGLHEIEEIINRALPFFSRQAESIRQGGLYAPPQRDLERVYILLAGCTLRASDEDPFPFVFICSEHSSDPFHVVKTGDVITVPHLLGIEYRLSRIVPSETCLEEAEAICQDFLIKRAKLSDDIGAPFYFARITLKGIRLRTREASVY